MEVEPHNQELAQIDEGIKRSFLERTQKTNYSNPILQKIDKFFCISQRGSTFWGEIRGGTAAFLATAYILAVNPSMISKTGGTCDPSAEDYGACVEIIKQDLVVATSVSTFLSTLFMGVFANLPFVLAPGMGLNAYFTFDVVGFAGSGSVTFETALGAIFIEGWLFLLLALIGARTFLARAFPKSLKFAMTIGIGMFLAHIGMQQAEGIGLVTADLATGIELGGCGHAGYSENMVCGVPDFAANGMPLKWGPTNEGEDPVFGVDMYCHCEGGKMQGATTWVGICCFLLISLLIVRGVKGAIIIGITFFTFVSWIKGHAASYFDCDKYDWQANYISDCAQRWSTFSQVAKFQGLQKTGGALQLDLSSSDLWIALFTFFYVDVLDTTGTLSAMANYMDIVDEQGNFPGQYAAFSIDAIGTILGSLMGTSPVTTYIESADGIREGARTGFASVVTALYFFLSIFFAPIFSQIPPWCFGPALIIVGCLMMKSVHKINWEDPAEALPAFVTIAVMPLTYSIAYGIIAGLFVHVVFWLVSKTDELIIARLGYSVCCGKLHKASDEASEKKEEIELPNII